MRTKLWKQRADLREGCKLCMGPKTGEALGFRGAISGLHPKGMKTYPRENLWNAAGCII